MNDSSWSTGSRVAAVMCGPLLLVFVMVAALLSVSVMLG
jgi:hypothetical protein